jgi:sigma-B regulation protein RsbU (phosphoserine phosphatase)
MIVISHGGGVRISSEDEADPETAAEAAGSDTAAGSPPIGPSVAEGGRIPGGALVPCLRWGDGGFSHGEVPVLGSTSLVESVAQLVPVAQENPLATVGLIALAFITVLLLGVIWATTSMVTTMIRSVTAAVRALREATTAIGEGRLDHRIAVTAEDDLWNVATSFNEMAAGLERMRSMERENQRLEQELQLAREIQHRLLPASAPSVPQFDIAGVSISAREVGGDYFDYLPLENGSVGIAVADVSGKGAAAALLMSSFRASLRSHDLAALGPARTLSHLNRFVHGSVAPGKFITAFLGVLDPETGRLTYSSAGHEPPLLIEPNGTTSELGTGGLVLGLFPQAEYEEASALLPKGALLAVFTDGVTEAQSPAGEFYGETQLVGTLQRLRSESCPRVLERIVSALKDFSGQAAQFDDVTMVLARRL